MQSELEKILQYLTDSFGLATSKAASQTCITPWDFIYDNLLSNAMVSYQMALDEGLLVLFCFHFALCGIQSILQIRRM